jgi:phosphoglycolate phosphatase-like HAD superfamily hydrolase
MNTPSEETLQRIAACLNFDSPWTKISQTVGAKGEPPRIKWSVGVQGEKIAHGVEDTWEDARAAVQEVRTLMIEAERALRRRRLEMRLYPHASSEEEDPSAE